MTRDGIFMAIPGGEANPFFVQVISALGPQAMKSLCDMTQSGPAQPAPSVKPQKPGF